MKKVIELDSVVVDRINELFGREGVMRKDIIMDLVRSGHDMKKVEDHLLEMDIKFRRGKGESWKNLCVEGFKENKEMSRLEMKKKISHMSDPQWYVDNWYDIFKSMVDM